ncbi:MAG: sulfotransferase [Planctomycetota bacterium]
MNFSIYDLWRQSPRDLFARVAKRFSKPTDSYAPENVRYIGCLSTGRVGSKTLSELGKLALGQASQHEPKPYLFGISKVGFEKDPYDPAIVAALECCREELVQEFLDPNQIFMETSPQVTFLAPAIKQLFPQSKFIHVIRHPVDVIRSGMRRQWYTGSGHDRWRIVPTDTDTFQRWDDMDAFEKNLWLWAETNHWITAYMSELNEEDGILIKSEQLFANDAETIQRFFQFIDAPVPAEGKIQRILGQNLNQQKTGTFPSIDDWTAAQKQLLHRYAGDLMEQYGYEVS